MHWFWHDNLSRCVDGISQKYAVARPSIPTVWLIQEGIDLVYKEVITLKEVGFPFDCNSVQSLFGSQLFSPYSSHVASMNAHSIVRLVDANC
jgi:hypothetical protein